MQNLSADEIKRIIEEVNERKRLEELCELYCIESYMSCQIYNMYMLMLN